MSAFIKTSSDRAAKPFPGNWFQCFQEVSISDQLDSSMLQYELIASYLGLSLVLRLQIHHRRLELFGFLFWLFFFFLEDPLRKLHEYCGTASPLHTGTKQDGTPEGVHKMTGQISCKKKVPNYLRRFLSSESLNESHNEIWATTVAKLIITLAAESDAVLPEPWVTVWNTPVFG